MDPATRLNAFEAAAQGRRAEVLHAGEADWPRAVRQALTQRGCRRVAHGRSNPQPGLEAALEGLQACRFDAPLEQWKAQLFEAVDADVTAAEARARPWTTSPCAAASEAPWTFCKPSALRTSAMRRASTRCAMSVGRSAATALQPLQAAGSAGAPGAVHHRARREDARAATPQEAHAIFQALARAHGVDRMIKDKDKAMVSEEMELNHRMAEQGLSCLESDMDEYIV